MSITQSRCKTECLASSLVPYILRLKLKATVVAVVGYWYLEEGQERGDAEGGSDDGEGAGRGVADVLVDVVNVGSHGGDHGGQAGRLGQVGDDLAALDAGVVVLVDEQRLDDDEDLVNVGPHQVVEFVEDAVDDLDEQVALLVLERRRHEQWQDLAEQRPGAELARLVRDLTQRRLAHRRRAVLDLERPGWIEISSVLVSPSSAIEENPPSRGGS